MSAQGKLIPLDKIRMDGDAQTRVEIDEDTVREYQQSYSAGLTLPPIRVLSDGKEHWPYDGFHRILAATRAGMKAIPCEVQKGTKEEARWLACSANQGHGLKRSNEDKQCAVATALRLKPKHSDNAIAAHCGVSQPFVSSVRKSLITVISEVDTKERIGTDGKTRPVKATKKKAQSAKASATENGHAEPPTPQTQPEPAPAPAVSLDECDLPIPAELEAVFLEVQRFDECERLLNAAQKLMGDLASGPAGIHLSKGMASSRGKDKTKLQSNDIANALTELRFCRPFVCACPYCLDDPKKDCQCCRGKGWTTKSFWKEAADDLKEAARVMRKEVAK